MIIKKPLLVVAFLCSVALLAGVPAGTASARPWTPTDSLIFNNLLGGHSGKYRIITQLDKAIDSAPRGSTITMAQYLFNIDSTSMKLVAAHRRGVHVQILIDDGTDTKQSRRLKKELGTNKSYRSFYATCRHSCMSNTGSTMHAKLYLFSTAGTRHYVSMVSSANPHKVNTIASWNNIHTIVNNKTIYGSLRRYFLDMIKDKNNLNYYRTTTSGKYKLYFFPRAARTPSQVALLDVLNHTSCTGVARGYGYHGKTMIRVEMWGWTSTRNDIAKRLNYLWNRGCKIQVIINRARISRTVLKTLLKNSTRYGKMPVYDAWVDRNKNDFGEKYMHHKALLINGRWYGTSAKVTYTGTQNFTASGTLYNNDIIMRVMGAATYNAYAKNMIYIRTHATHRLWTVPLILRDTYGGGDQRIKGYQDPGVTDADLESLQDS